MALSQGEKKKLSLQLFPSFASEPDPHLLNLGLDASAVNLTGSDLAGLIIYTDFGLVLKQSIRCSNMKRENERERANGWNGNLARMVHSQTKGI